MKLSWPTQFAEGDVESWLEEFEAIAACNGVKGDGNLLTALGTLLTGRAKATYLLTRKVKAGGSFAEMKAALCLEFGKEIDRQHALQQFHSAKWEEPEDLMVFFHRLSRHVAIGLPELDAAARERLLRGQFIQSLPPELQEKVKLASMVGVEKAEELVTIAQSFLGSVTVRRVQPSELERKVHQLSCMVEQLLARDNQRNTARRNCFGNRSSGRCFRCNRTGHFARYCTNNNFYRCFSLSIPSRWQVPILEITIEGVLIQAIVDTGAGVSITKRVDGVPLTQSSVVMQTVGGYRLKVTGVQHLRLGIGKTQIRHSMFVVEGATETIIGNDILRRLGARIDLRNDVVIVDKERIVMNTGKSNRVGSVAVIPDCSNHAIRETLLKYAHLFTDANDDYGFCDWIEHRIRLIPGERCKPVFRRIPQKTMPEVKKQVAEMEAKGIIRRTTSPYSSPVLLTKKADGTFRFCIDFRELNRVTVKDAFPMPQMDEIFASLHSAKHISLIDLRSGYWQLPIAKEDRHKTAFSVNDQQYEFLRMPFGLCNAPATFRRLLLMILENLQGVVVYGDDIIIYSETEREHATRLAAVLQRLDEAGLKLSRKKSQIAQKSIVCLGHIVGDGQVKPLPEKRETIKNFAVPKSKRQLRSFLGIVAYDSRFVPHFAEKISPLLKLLHKDEPFVWTPEADQAFSHLKTCVTEGPACLRIPSPGEKFTVSVDASNVAIGAVLSQPAGVIEYASRVLTAAEQKYSTTEKECLAIVWALEKWRTYLLANEFRVITDHKPLSWLMTSKDPRGRLARWAYRLQEFTFTIEHVDGTKNILPDMLSRPTLDALMPEMAIPVCAVTAEDRSLLENQKTEEFVRLLCEHLQAGTKPDAQSGEMNDLLKIWDQLHVVNGNLLVSVNGKKVPYIPQTSRERVIQMTHDNAHMGFERVYDLLRRRVFWPTMRKDVAAYIRRCPNCQKCHEMDAPRPPMKSVEVNEPLQCWGLDVFGPLPVSRWGNSYVLVMIDHFTRWVEAVPIKDQTGETVARAFEFNVPARYGIPQYVITDQGPCFESKAFQTLLNKWGIERRRTSPYHPQANGMTERFNRTMKEWITCTNLAWEDALPEVLLSYRASMQSTTKISPFELQFGREPRIALDTCISEVCEQQHPAPHHKRLQDMARRGTRSRQQRNKLNYDARYATHKWRPFNIGDQVKVRKHDHPIHRGPGASKFKERWQGPYTVVDRKGVNVKVDNGMTKRWMNTDLMRPWHTREQQLRGGAGVDARRTSTTRNSRKRQEQERVSDRGTGISQHNAGPTGRVEKGPRATTGRKSAPGRSQTILEERSRIQTKTPIVMPQRMTPSRVTPGRSSKSRAFEQIQAGRKATYRSGDTKQNRRS